VFSKSLTLSITFMIYNMYVHNVLAFHIAVTLYYVTWKLNLVSNIFHPLLLNIFQTYAR